MDEPNSRGELFGAGAVPGPKMSEEYMLVMFDATVALIELGQKITDRINLTPEEGARLLNASWTVYLFALGDGDIQEAKEAADFTTLVSKYLELCGYLVRFEDKGYCVQKGK